MQIIVGIPVIVGTMILMIGVMTIIIGIDTTTDSQIVVAIFTGMAATTTV